MLINVPTIGVKIMDRRNGNKKPTSLSFPIIPASKQHNKYKKIIIFMVYN